MNLPPSRILIRATNWVGDAVMCIPALEAVRERFPDAYIAVLARPWVAALYTQPLVDEVIPYTPARGFKDFRAKFELAQQLRRMDFDTALLFQNAFEAAALMFAARIPRRIGYDRDGRGFLLTDPVPVPKKGVAPVHERFYYLELLRRIRWIEELPPSEAITLPNVGQLRAAGRRRFRALGIPGEVVGVSPGAAYGTAKRWIPERFAESATTLAALSNASVVVFGSQDEVELCEKVRTLVQEGGINALNMAGQTSLAEYVEFAAACSVYLTNDSGAMHVASAAKVPTIAVFGATSHEGTGPTGKHARVVRKRVDCSPCLLRECPIDHRCMTAVSADDVTATALELVRIRTV